MFANRHVQFFATVALIAFLTAGIFGISQGMEVGQNGLMSNCPFMTGTGICTMTPFEHMAAWQSAFSFAPIKNTLALLASIALAFVALLAFADLRRLWEDALNLAASTQKVRYRYRLQTANPTPLQELFSNGILNPKVF